MEKDPGARITEIADQLRALATNGLHYSPTEYDTARYESILHLSAELLSIADTRDTLDIERAYRGDLGYRTPFVGAAGAVFNEEGKILLVQRSDNNKWNMPGGMADVGESPASAAVRETWEETGLRVVPTRFVGIYNRQFMAEREAIHLYNLLFICKAVGGELTLTNETVAYSYFTEEEAMALPLHGQHGVRIHHAFQAYRGELNGTLFE